MSHPHTHESQPNPRRATERLARKRRLRSAVQCALYETLEDRRLFNNAPRICTCGCCMLCGFIGPKPVAQTTVEDATTQKDAGKTDPFSNPIVPSKLSPPAAAAAATPQTTAPEFTQAAEDPGITPSAVITGAPLVTSTSPVANGTGVSAGIRVNATFNEDMLASSINSTTVQLKAPGNVTVPSKISYNPFNDVVTISPNTPLSYNTTYTVQLTGGASGIKDSTSDPLATNPTWSFTTAVSPTEGTNGPILVITNPANAFSSYYPEVLRAEGLNEFATNPIAAVTAANLAPYKTVILGEMTLTAAQVTMFTNWVNAGGNLIAMKPDAQLLSLLGLTDTGATISDTYLDIDNTNNFGAGLTDTTMQYHGQANRYNLSGATALATLFSNSTTSISNPAVSVRNVGANGGQAVMFAFDLAKSIVYTRQGNPAWAAQERDGQTPIRADDMFFGGASPDWVDLNKVFIPQADEQQRFLANIVHRTTIDQMPLPRLWYLPKGNKAVVVMTGDDHSSGGTTGRFNAENLSGTSGSESLRSTSYIYTNTITDSAAADWSAQGFEVGLHVSILNGANPRNWTSFADLDNLYTTQLNAYNTAYPSLPSPATHRVHAIVWSDFDSQPQVEFSHNMRLDTNYYYWPGSWIQDRPGMFTGSGLPQRFTKADGTLIDVYQATTQITDESNQTYINHINTLLDNATGVNGYYGAFTANMHTDSASSLGHDIIVNSAKAHGVPVTTSERMLKFLDGRNNTSFQNIAWSNGTGTLTFNVDMAAGATDLQAMVPVQMGTNLNVSSITVGGSSVAFTTQFIKGVNYAFFPVNASAAVSVQYVQDTTAPTVTNRTPASGSSGQPITAKPTITFSEDVQPGTISFVLKDAANNTIPGTTSYSSASRTATFTPTNNLATTTTYTATVSGVTDLSGNVIASPSVWSFTTAGTGPFNIFGNATPTNPFFADSSIEVGVKFKADVDGFISGLRFYKGSGNTGTHSGHLWTVSGTLLGTLTFSGESATGWQTQNFASPIAITAGTTYVASYHTTTGYAADGAYFTNTIDSTYLHALSTTEGLGNGIYGYGGPATFPTNNFNATNYWVDPVFILSSGPDTTPPTVVTKVPASGATGVSVSTTVQAVFSESVQSGTITFELRDAGNNLIPGTTNYVDATRTATFTPTNPLNGLATYTATVSGAKDLANNTMTSTSWSFTTADATPPTVSGRTPAPGAINVPTSTTVSATFSESVQPGTISFVLKDAANNTVPSTVSYNDTTKIVTLTPNAALAQATQYTATLSNAQDLTGNVMTTSTWSFTTLDSVAPTVIARNPAPGATNVPFSSTITATFSESIQPGTLVFTVNDGTSNIAGSVSYNDTTKVATFTPSAPLALSTTFTVNVSGAQDLTGNTMTPVNWSFTTAASNFFSIWNDSVVPGTPFFADNPIELGLKFQSNVSGLIAGIKFYKGAGNTGTHIGTLWDANGNVLAQATFQNESATGWQTVTFSTPILIQPNTTYVASYHTNTGYAADGAYFTSSVTSGALRALSSSESGGNGVYGYSATPALPINSFNATNYWVDVVFTPPDATAPTVTTRTPASGATNVPIATTATATFSEAVVSSTISFVLKDAANNTIPGTTSYDANTFTATFTPTSLLSSTTTYTATVSGTQDPSGNTMTSTSWSFTTADQTAPTVTARTPAPNAVLVPVNTTVTATFSEPVVSGTISLVLKDAANNTIPGTTSYNSGTKTVTFTPTSALNEATTYTATLSNAQDPAGNTMTTVAWSFLTIDTNAPTITNKTPAAGAVNIPLNTTVTATFNEPVVSGTISFVLKDAANVTIPGTTSYNSGTNTVTFTPTSALTSTTTYTATLSGAQDPSGNTMTTVVWSFTTADQTPPTITARTPASGATNVAVTAPITATFSEDVQPGTIVFDVKIGTTPVPGTVSYNAPTRVATFTPTTTPLTGSTTYTATVSGVQDIAGNTIVSSSWSFTTIDNVPPSISARTPAAGSTGVHPALNITATFNEAVQSGTIVFTLKDASQVNVPGANSYNSTTRVATFDPTANLVAGAVYTASISATDTIGNAMAAPITWTFTTAGASDIFTIWTAANTPASQNNNDGPAIAVGTKFQASTGGYVTGVKFFKGASNTGTHTASLWNSGGTRLAQATYSGETASGWQTVSFASPIAITVGSTYIVSTFSDSGFYALTDNYFTTAHTNGPITALANSTSVNGVYRYNTDGFPNANSGTASNYWVDVVFQQGDTLAPSLQTLTPANGASAIPINTTVNAKFTESVQSATITFVLKDPANNTIPGTTTYNDINQTVTFTPTSSLLGSTTYTATLSGAKDTAGNTMTTASWSFTTVSSDVTPPTITAQTPAPGAVNVPANTTVTATFSEAVQSGTISFVLKDAANNTVPGTTSYNSGTHIATFTPTSALGSSITYTATVSGALDMNNNAMAAPVSWSFTTADTVAPTITARTPASGATNVAVNSTVTATFSEAVQSGTIVLVLKDAANNVIPGTLAYDAPSKTATFTPTSVLASTTTYTATVSGTQDLAGNTMTQTSWSFTTADIVPPTITARTPASGATNVPVNTTVTATFSESVQSGTIALVLKDAANNVIPGTLTYDAPSKTATFTPTSALSSSTGYTVTVSGAQDLSGNTMTLTSWSFTTADVIAPTITARTPASGATNVPVNSSVTATFSESVQAGTIVLVLKDAANNVIPGTLSYDAPSKTATFTPTSALSSSTVYTVTVSSAQDLAGNTMTLTSWSFTTADVIAPTITSHTPATGATNVPVNSSVTATFSESVQSGTIVLVLKDAADNVIPGTLAYDAPSKIATFTPTSPLSSSTSYTATVSGAQDLAGNTMTLTSWSFTAADIIPPTITAHTPASGAVNVPVNSTVTATFSESVQPGTIVLVLKDAADNVIPGALSYDGPSKTATFTPSSPLSSSTTYTATVSSAQDLAGNTMALTSWSFTTADVIAPTLTSITPANGAANVAPTATINATFSESVQAGTIVLVLKDAADNVVPGTLSYDTPSKTATFTPTSALSSSTTYTVTVSGAQDLAGNTLTQESWSFTTADVIAPTVTAHTPASDATGVSVNATVTATFSESVVAATISLVVKDAADNTVAGSTSYDNLTKTVTFTPAAALSSQTTYTVTISGAQDPSGNTITTTNWSFTTADVIAPTLTAHLPASGAINVPLASAITATFSESVQSGTIVIVVRDAADNVVPGTLAYDAPSKTATFTPTSALSSSSVYAVTVSGAQDLSGNTMTQAAWSFTTADVIAPTVTSVTPASGAINVAVNSNVTVTFSESVQSGTIVLVLKDAADNVIPGTLSYDGPSKTASFTPTSALSSTTTYTATVSGAQDLSGNTMTEQSWSFTTADVAAPFVSAHTPASNATGVSVTAPITITFNEAIDPQTLSFIVQDDADDFVVGTVSYDALTKTATFTLEGQLASLTGYHVTVSGAQDLAGNTMDQLTWSFLSADVLAPNVVAFSPADAATNVAASSPITVSFDEWMQPGSIVIVVKDAANNVVPGSISYDNNTFTATFTPTSALASGTTYTATLSSAQDLAGNNVSPLAWSFTTADTVAPTVATHTPASGAINVAVNSTVTATFSESVQAGTIVLVLKDAADNVIPGTLSYDAPTKTATFTPSSDLSSSAVYTVTVSGAQDPSGNTMTLTSWSFTAADVVAPSLTGGSPASGAIDVPVSSTITASFSESVVSGTIAFTVLDQSNNSVPGVVTYDAPSKTATFTPTSYLSSSTTYTITISGAQDAGGNTMSSDNWSFTTADVIAPGVVTHAPAASATNVSPSIIITASFTEAVQPGTIVFVVKDSSDNVVPGTVSYDSLNNVAAFTPTSALASSTTYSVTVSSAQDAAGNTMSPVAWTFTTADVIAPTVTANTPTNGATGVSRTPSITVTFSEAMNASTINSSTLQLRDAASNLIAANVSYDSNTRIATLTPTAQLAFTTTYTLTVKGGAGGVSDSAGNTIASDFTSSFATINPLTWTQTTTADFQSGSSSGLTIANGDVALTPAFTDDFSGSTLSSAWTQTNWSGLGNISLSVDSGILSIGRKQIQSVATYTNTGVEGRINFTGGKWQQFGLATSLSTLAGTYSAVFTTRNEGTSLYARVNNNGAISDVLIGATPSGFHNYTVRPVTGGFAFFIDGAQVATVNRTIPGSVALRAVFSSQNGSPSFQADWIRVPAYTTGTYTSAIFDAGHSATWLSASFTGPLPAGTSLLVEISTGDTATPDGSWSAWTPVTSGADITSLVGRYIRYRISFSTTDGSLTPTLSDITLSYL